VTATVRPKHHFRRLFDRRHTDRRKRCAAARRPGAALECGYRVSSSRNVVRVKFGHTRPALSKVEPGPPAPHPPPFAPQLFCSARVQMKELGEGLQVVGNILKNLELAVPVFANWDQRHTRPAVHHPRVTFQRRWARNLPAPGSCRWGWRARGTQKAGSTSGP